MRPFPSVKLWWHTIFWNPQIKMAWNGLTLKNLKAEIVHAVHRKKPCTRIKIAPGHQLWASSSSLIWPMVSKSTNNSFRASETPRSSEQHSCRSLTYKILPQRETHPGTQHNLGSSDLAWSQRHRSGLWPQLRPRQIDFKRTTKR